MVVTNRVVFARAAGSLTLSRSPAMSGEPSAASGAYAVSLFGRRVGLDRLGFLDLSEFLFSGFV